MLAFALVLIRISAFIVSWPVFSIYSVPQHTKILLALCIAIVLFPVIDKTGLGAKGWSQDLIWLAGKEALTGLCLGFMTRLFFFAVSVGGNLIATSTGLANAQLFNPTLGSQGSTVEQFYVVIATLLFLALNGHHFFLTGLVESFQAIPLSISGTEFASLTSKFGHGGGSIVQSVMEAGIKISAPVLIALFMMNVVMGIIGRAVPQVNVLITSMSANFLAGLMVMIAAIPALVFQLNHDVVDFAEQLFKLLKSI